ncbi:MULTISPECIES: copper resistance CopC family protein [Acidithiobacillus]|jgi:methionine-rich copper-binding protein CopC|uniref:Copper resistance protein CopC n=1 Tax=Acidithiobacillus ferrooxidans TaxID=920 RepID=A0A2W1KG12_ACIFR|nr:MULTISPECIES: copper resistance CopC family protein [Acidithiobacillus]MDA8376127.1 copper resistance protein CopC [Planctomycetia bacterium]ACH84478.1 copper resistance protein CopC [Acidithiobacillus ferrooxidans ATCC 53993]MBN6745109.1 copper resistance protein CopC [Acidithiobacillus sp. MC2.2]MBN6746940.1 copper resistance protein CopC [Acidithiobacillus sp. PG05]MBU2773674.1 copper resistance protein CopC [Acidithiobacillus ferrooxidans]
MTKKAILKNMLSRLTILAAFTLVPNAAYAHAFPDKSSPTVGSTLATAPKKVTIWYDASIDRLFSKLTVKNAQGAVVSLTSHVSRNRIELSAPLKPLVAGKYFVYWSVVASDGHHTHGHWSFAVK